MRRHKILKLMDFLLILSVVLISAISHGGTDVYTLAQASAANSAQSMIHFGDAINADNGSAIELASFNKPNIATDISPAFAINTTLQNQSFINYSEHFVNTQPLLPFGEDLASVAGAAAAAVWPQESNVHGVGAEFTPFIGIEAIASSANISSNVAARSHSQARFRRRMFAELTYGLNSNNHIQTNELYMPTLSDKLPATEGHLPMEKLDVNQVLFFSPNDKLSPHFDTFYDPNNTNTELINFPEPRQIIPRVLKPMISIEGGIVPIFQKHQILSLGMLKPHPPPLMPAISRDYSSSNSHSGNGYNSNNYQNNNQPYSSNSNTYQNGNSNSYPYYYGGISSSNYGSSSSNSYAPPLPPPPPPGYGSYNSGAGGYVQNLFPYYYSGGAGLYSPPSYGAPVYSSPYASSSGTNPLSSIVAAALLSGYGAAFPYGSYNNIVTYSTVPVTTPSPPTTVSTTRANTVTGATTGPTTRNPCIGNSPIQITTLPTPCTITKCVDLIGVPPLMATPNTVACMLSTTGGMAGTVMLSILMNGNFVIMNGNLVLNTLMNDGAMPTVTVTAVDGCGQTASTQITVPITCAPIPG